MFVTRLFPAAALLLGLLIASPSLAQGGGGVGVNTGAADSYAIGGRDEYFRNMDSALRDFSRETTRERAERLRDEAAAARAAATAAGVTCQVTEAVQIGQTTDGVKLYETACAAGPGYLIATTTPPRATSCVVVNTAARHFLAANPQGEPPASCTLPANLNVDAAIAGYARDAGIDCTVDEVRAIGQVGDRAIYEIGCAGRDGYRITPSETGWDKISCLAVANAGSTCAFTTQDEQFATLRAYLESTPASDCVVDGGRYMGASANGVYYEAKCANTAGYIFRVKDGRTEAFPCAEAQGIAGGCRLTAVVAATPAPEN
ncbi:MAG: hypothetical protein EON88_11940 [Brevundimonas sp.]|nr:MAG: hypothetical protein EON88_11940 [Brevundimonas sp.]